MEAHSQVKVSGKVVNEKGEGVEFMEILLKNKNGTIVKSGLTGEDGAFLISCAKGDYTIVLRQLGETYLSKEISVGDEILLGKIVVSIKAQEL